MSAQHSGAWSENSVVRDGQVGGGKKGQLARLWWQES